METDTATPFDKTDETEVEETQEIDQIPSNEMIIVAQTEEAVAIPIFEVETTPFQVETAFSLLETEEPSSEWKLLRKQVHPLPRGSSFNDVYLVQSYLKLEKINDPRHREIAHSVNMDVRTFLANNNVTVGGASNRNYNKRSSMPLQIYTRVVWMQIGGCAGRFVGGKLAIAWVISSGKKDDINIHAGRKIVLRSHRALHPVACLYANEEQVIRSMGLKLANKILKDVQTELES